MTEEVKKTRKPNSWIKHLKAYSKQNNIPYASAISDPTCRELYLKSKGKATPLQTVPEDTKPVPEQKPEPFEEVEQVPESQPAPVLEEEQPLVKPKKSKKSKKSKKVKKKTVDLEE
jgi:hypothetical protein